MTKTILIEIKKHLETKDNKQFLSCSNALQIANKLDIAPGKIGNVCNEEKIKLKSCQIGCF